MNLFCQDAKDVYLQKKTGYTLADFEKSPFKGFCGGVAEWLKAHAWKVCKRATVS
jgi:hypothetical protein